jgi:pilus assembly protein CpaC
VQTTVELADGQSFALAGLLNNNVSATTDAVPLLGDVPILGQLFRSTKYLRKETELVVLVTPRLVAPMNPDQTPLLPGEHWRYPTEFQLYGLSDVGGPVVEPGTAAADKAGKAGSAAKHPAAPPPQFHGTFGYTPVGAGGVAPVTQ